MQGDGSATLVYLCQLMLDLMKEIDSIKDLDPRYKNLKSELDTEIRLLEEEGEDGMTSSTITHNYYSLYFRTGTRANVDNTSEVVKGKTAKINSRFIQINLPQSGTNGVNRSNVNWLR